MNIHTLLTSHTHSNLLSLESSYKISTAIKTILNKHLLAHAGILAPLFFHVKFFCFHAPRQIARHF